MLTDRSIKSKDKTPGYYLDGQGLYLQVAPGGSRSWVLRYTLNKKAREMGLGSFDTFGLAKARERAQHFRQLVADGIDPIEHRRQLRDTPYQPPTAPDLPTFSKCAHEYHQAHADNWKNAKHGDQWINTLTAYAFPKFGEFPVAAVGKPQVLAALTPIWQTKAETASRLLQRIRLVLNYAAAKDYRAGLDAEFWQQVKLALGANDRARKVEHHSSCPYANVGALLATVQASTASTVVKLAFEFTILTAARSGEVRGACWSEFDAGYTSWTIPGERMKAGREHRVPLPARATALLKEVHAARTGHGPLVFPSAKNAPLSDMTFTQLMRREGLPYTMHGFRASFRTWGMEATDYPDEMLEFALAHVVGDQTVRAYARSDMVAKRRKLMQDWADYLLATRANQLATPAAHK
ncbi:MAG: integrase arm-type DNA-binding domain-containing protein [Polaromonas sp.]|uniref:tyrosine-type recombinase/integrase n=1 Tax=Polaromonas sp. TaxID=1869339 RepID=UPI00273731C4|nr:site-specific integrase [Polaromonas sp.]MDP3799212.1 integrase arm-type DNA-binding domain-containing protein [Polaromonas sp.]